MVARIATIWRITAMSRVSDWKRLTSGEVLLESDIEAKFPAFTGGFVGKVELEIPEFGDLCFEMNRDFFSGVVARGRGKFDFEGGGFFEVYGVGEDIAREVARADF
jgi:hypothetical protein